MTIEFGTLEAVNLREIWANESNDFTPWLANNLSYVSDAIGIPLDLVKTEASVGRFSADILARAPDGEFALIENQLEWSDHAHMGQILTYLAGLEARTVIWVALGFTEAHLAAIRWLNANTPADFSFFAISVWAVKIGDSLPALQFEVWERPSDSDGEVRAAAQTSGDARAAAQPSVENRDLSPQGSFNSDFWTHHADRHPDDGVQRGFAGFNPTFPVQGTEFFIRWYHAERNQVGMWVTGRGGRRSQSILAALRPYLPALAKELGVNPTQMSRIAAIRLDIDISNPDNWAQAADWLHEVFEIYIRVLSQPPN